MSYRVKVLRTADSGSGVSIEAKVDDEVVAHTFPKGMGYFEERDGERPPFVEKLEEKYEEKLKRQGKASIQETSTEESKIHGEHFENKVYGDDSKNFKHESNENNNMEVNLNKPEQIRKYLKENMAEGYLSEEEGLNIDQFVDRYEEMMETKENFQEIIQEVQTGRVQ